MYRSIIFLFEGGLSVEWDGGSAAICDLEYVAPKMIERSNLQILSQ